MRKQSDAMLVLIAGRRGVEGGGDSDRGGWVRVNPSGNTFEDPDGYRGSAKRILDRLVCRHDS